MTGCCDEYDCRRTEPIRFYLGDFAGVVYASTRTEIIRRNHDGTALMRSVKRHDVTDQMREFIRRNPEWVHDVLASEQDEIQT